MLTDIASLILTDALGEIATDVVESQLNKGLKASGKSANSLRAAVDSDGTTLSGKLYGSFTFTYQENGRGPNATGKPSRAMVEQITEWTRIKGVNIPPWAIATKIAREGIRVPNRYNPGGVLSEVLNSDVVKEKVAPRLRKEIFNSIKSSLLDL